MFRSKQTKTMSKIQEELEEAISYVGIFSSITSRQLLKLFDVLITKKIISATDALEVIKFGPRKNSEEDQQREFAELLAKIEAKSIQENKGVVQ